MKKKEWNEGLNHLDHDLVEKYVEQKDRLKQNKRHKKIWLHLGAVAACFALLVSAIIVVPMLRQNKPIPIPIVNIQTPSSAPRYYGNEFTTGMSVDGNMEVHPKGLSVTAQLVETLPDTYTFFDDWHQYEYRLLRMKTIKLLSGKEMTEEFYYMVPVDFMTDFSIFDTFVIKDMAQFGYEYSVMYNKTQGKAEQLHIVLFGYRNYGYYLMGTNFMAFDSDGNFDERLWNANEAWRAATENAQAVDTITQTENNISQEPNDDWGKNLYVHLLKDISSEAANVLSQVNSFENGLFVPTFSSTKLSLTPEVQFSTVRYINGFATNEAVRVWCKEWSGGEQDTYAFTQARFSEEDFNHLPDLPSAFTTITNALDNGSITPPHFKNDAELRNTTTGAFGWYAKTENGVIGIVRVTWCFFTEDLQSYYDDAYYIIEYGTDECKPISRDALLEQLGTYEATYIFTGEYDKNGKVLPYT